MPKGFQSQQCQRYGRYGLEWTASFCCPWLFKTPVVAVPDNSPKAGRHSDHVTEIYNGRISEGVHWESAGDN